MWEDEGNTTGEFPIETVEPDEILEYYDRPLLFTATPNTGHTVLFYWAGRTTSEAPERYICVPAHSKLIDDLKNGFRTLRETLKEGWTWVVHIDQDANVERAWSIDFSEIPDEFLPEPGLMLEPEHQPFLTLTAKGDELEVGEIRASVVKKLADSATKALKRIAEFHLDVERSPGRVAESLRRFWDLRTTRFSYGSFGMSFQLPDDPQQEIDEAYDDNLRKMSDDLRNALDWLDHGDNEFETMSEERRRAMLNALDELLPPARGDIESVEVSGRSVDNGVSSGTYEISRDARQQVKRAAKALESEEQLLRSGTVRAIDLDSYTFRVARDETTTKTEQITFRFDEEHREKLLDSLAGERKVIAIGRRGPDAAKVTLIALIPVGDEA